MIEPIRWSSSGSEVDPVLRAVLRYAQNLSPTPGEVQQLLLRAQANKAEQGHLRRWFVGSGKPRVAALVAALTMFGGVAWAGYAFRGLREPEPRKVTAASALPTSVRASAIPQPRRSARSTPTAPVPPPTAVPTGAAIPRTMPVPVQPNPSLSPQLAESPLPVGTQGDSAKLDEVALLQQARHSVGTDPDRALALTQEHAALFPSSVLAEERGALRVQALARLGRKVEAEQELRLFLHSFPHSPYRRLLQSH